MQLSPHLRRPSGATSLLSYSHQALYSAKCPLQLHLIRHNYIAARHSSGYGQYTNQTPSSTGLLLHRDFSSATLLARRFKPLESAFGRNDDHYFTEHESVTPVKPLVELEMVRLSAALRSKSSWWIKFRNQNILAKWRAEALEQAELMKESHIDYVLKELDGYANLRDGDTGIEVACYERIWQSDRLIPASLKDRLIAGVAKLENVTDAEKDWHPRSNGQVLDLIHPSLYPIVYGRTLAYPEGCTDRDASKLAPVPAPEIPDPATISSWQLGENYHVSQMFQWLPTNFNVSKDGKSVKSASYINNLNPDQHPSLHNTTEELVAAYIPLFERVLTDSIFKNKAIPKRVPNEYSYDEANFRPPPEDPDAPYDPTKGDDAYDEWQNTRPIILPDVSAHGYVLGSLERRQLKYELAGKTIQVIVKLANIHLTPEKPKYSGGSWHIEGMSNEAIAVSGIYYYAEDNISESRLAFRTAVSMARYEQGDNRGCRLTWGIDEFEACVQELGAVTTSQDRCIAFPNTYQHQVSPFELEDKTKPGHRKIVALFLVDPAIRRPSTTTVPPQQQEWQSAAVLTSPILQAAFGKLALETIYRAESLAEGTMTREEAEAYRLELMEERTAFVEENTEEYFNVSFHMCEH